MTDDLCRAVVGLDKPFKVNDAERRNVRMYN